MMIWLQQDAGTDGQATEGGAPKGRSLLHVLDAESTRTESREKANALIERVLSPQVRQAYDQLNSQTVFGLNAFGLVAAIFFLLLAYLVSRVVRLVMDRYLKPFVEQTTTKYDDQVVRALRRQVSTFVMIWGLFLAFTFLDLPGRANGIIWSILTTWLIINIGLILYRGLEITLSWLGQLRREDSSSALDSQFIPMIRDAGKVILITLVVLTCVQSWGGDITAVLTGVGIGGLALAFAAQDTVANVFGSFMIFMDRPFKRGDWIVMAGVEGDVEEIGIRSTRIRCFDKTVVSVPNKIVTNENIQNFSARDQRRINMDIGITYDSSPDQVRAAVAGIRRILSEHPDIDQSSYIVRFSDFGASALNILVYCFTKTAVWSDYLVIREDLNLRIMDLFEEIGVEFAFPSQSVYLHNMTDGRSGKRLAPEGKRERKHPLPSTPLEKRSRAENETGMDAGEG
ncbi:MAG: mechanosensitive ion channel family protein [Planctomycetales bacterium]|nr:mechanosensitive ion channel family protein [bacterium]UNM09615.1 MAG: mechanosensitive ion channel family protein [Planctomycetales bacterium]